MRINERVIVPYVEGAKFTGLKFALGLLSFRFLLPPSPSPAGPRRRPSPQHRKSPSTWIHLHPLISHSLTVSPSALVTLSALLAVQTATCLPSSSSILHIPAQQPLSSIIRVYSDDGTSRTSSVPDASQARTNSPEYAGSLSSTLNHHHQRN